MSALARLLEQATPGSWHTEGFNNLDAIVPLVLAADGQNVTPALDFDQWGDARLIALAPDMARLLIDMAAHLQVEEDDLVLDDFYIDTEQFKRAELLARFAELEQRAAP